MGLKYVRILYKFNVLKKIYSFLEAIDYSRSGTLKLKNIKYLVKTVNCTPNIKFNTFNQLYVECTV